jgi:hypothetical protein
MAVEIAAALNDRVRECASNNNVFSRNGHVTDDTPPITSSNKRCDIPYRWCAKASTNRKSGTVFSRRIVNIPKIAVHETYAKRTRCEARPLNRKRTLLHKHCLSPGCSRNICIPGGVHNSRHTDF